MKIKLTVSYIKIFLPNNKISGQITEKSGDYSSFFNFSQFNGNDRFVFNDYTSSLCNETGCDVTAFPRINAQPICLPVASINTPGFSVGTLRHVNSLSFSFPASFFLQPMSTVCPFSNEFGEPELCMLSVSYHWHV